MEPVTRGRLRWGSPTVGVVGELLPGVLSFSSSKSAKVNSEWWSENVWVMTRGVGGVLAVDGLREQGFDLVGSEGKPNSMASSNLEGEAR